MILKRYITTLLVLIASLPVFGQIRLNFVPEIYGRNLSGLFNCQIVNAQQPLTGALMITVTERESGMLCAIKTPEFTIMPGANPVPAQAARNASIQFSDTKSGRLLRMSSMFASGDYDYCYTLTLKNSDGIPDEQCFSYVLAPFSEFSLIDPYDKDELCDKRPVFTWQPLVPSVPGAAYQFILTEIKTGQNATEAINYNLPLINQRNLISPVLPFPAVARELENGKRYAWQVAAYKELTVLNRSEVWEFTVTCTDSTKKDAADTVIGYRDIGNLSRGNFSVVYSRLRFGMVNPYKPQELKYGIEAIAEPGKKIKRLPKVKLRNGSNEIIIDLSGNSAFTNGAFYIVTVMMPDGSSKRLRFLYQEEK